MTPRKHILIISPFFYPELISTGKLNTDFAIALKEKGHNVKVLCYHPFYPKWKIKINQQKIEGINIIRGGKFVRFPKKTFIRRIILEVSFTFFVLRKSRVLFKNIDIVLPIFPPSLAFICLLFFIPKKVKKVGVVHDLQEIYAENKKGFFNKIISFFIHKTEKRCFTKCDKLIFLSNEMKVTATRLYSLKNKLAVQYPFYSIKKKSTNDLNHIFDKSKINIVYSGALGEKQNPKELFNFFNFASQSLKNVEFLIFSQGDVFETLKKENRSSQIKFNNLVPKKNLTELYEKSDIQIIPQLPNTSKGSLPSKLPNLLVSGCKVLVITDKKSEMDTLFKKYNFERVVTTWDFDILLSNLLNLIESKINIKRQIKLSKQLFDVESMINESLS